MKKKSTENRRNSAMIAAGIAAAHAGAMFLTLRGIAGQLGSGAPTPTFDMGFLDAASRVLSFPIFEPAYSFGFHVLNHSGGYGLLLFPLNSLLWGVGAYFAVEALSRRRRTLRH
jgi:hypothetical protein